MSASQSHRATGQPRLACLAGPALGLVLVGLSLAACGPTTTATPNPTSAATSQTAASPQATPAVALFKCGNRTVTWDGTSTIDLTGTWAGDDDGVYYIRQIGDQVWWLGMSGLGNPLVKRGSDWTNVYTGQIAGDTITGRYADVPQGTTLLEGPVVMKLTKTAGGGISLVRSTPDSETEFGGKVFTPCKLG